LTTNNCVPLIGHLTIGSCGNHRGGDGKTGVRRGENQQVAAGRAGRITNDQIIGGIQRDTKALVRLALVITCDGVLAEVRGWVKTLIWLVNDVANRSPVLLKARVSTKVEGTVLECRRWEPEPVIGPLKIEMAAASVPYRDITAESTATAVTSLAVASDRVAVGVEPVRGSAN